jgi:hypothetical protein
MRGLYILGEGTTEEQFINEILRGYSNEGFDFLPDIPIRNKQELQRAVQEYDNPEMLNDGPNTAPSKRLERLIPGYQKALHGPFIAEIVTLAQITSRCERFRQWLERLVVEMK